jgi:DHA3 family macrolide efflux protein-like MFS transporter
VTQFYVPSEAPLIPKILPKHLLVSANSLFSFTFYSSLALGTILAGPLLRFFGPYGVFFFIAILFLSASALSSRIRSQSYDTIGFRHVLGYDFRYVVTRIYVNLIEGVRYVSQSGELFDAIILLTGTQIIMALLGTLGPGFADRVLHVDIRDASILIVAPAVLGILLGAVWVGTIGYKFKEHRLIQIGVNGAGWTLIAVAVMVRILRFDHFSWVYEWHLVFPVIIILFFLLGIANSFLDVPANAILQNKAQGPLRSRVYGILGAFVGGVGILPVIIGGVLADTVGVGKVIFILGAIIAVYGIYRVRYNKITL